MKFKDLNHTHLFRNMSLILNPNAINQSLSDFFYKMISGFVFSEKDEIEKREK